MTITYIMFAYLFLILFQVGMCFIKNKIFGALPICLTLLLFLLTMKGDFYDIAIFQIIIFVLDLLVNNIIKRVLEKKNKTEIDRMKIKDL